MYSNPPQQAKKWKGEIGPPYLKPDSIGNSSLGEPLTNIDVVADPTHSNIHLRHK